jgi:hypothetical protein
MHFEQGVNSIFGGIRNALCLNVGCQPVQEGKNTICEPCDVVSIHTIQATRGYTYWRPRT